MVNPPPWVLRRFVPIRNPKAHIRGGNPWDDGALVIDFGNTLPAADSGGLGRIFRKISKSPGTGPIPRTRGFRKEGVDRNSGSGGAWRPDPPPEGEGKKGGRSGSPPVPPGHQKGRPRAKKKARGEAPRRGYSSNTLPDLCAGQKFGASRNGGGDGRAREESPFLKQDRGAKAFDPMMVNLGFQTRGH